MQDIINNPQYPWNWGDISSNPNLTMNMIKQYPDKKWNWDKVYANPLLTIEDIINNLSINSDSCSWYNVFTNEFTLDKELYVNNQFGRLLLVSMLEDYNNDISTLLDNTLLVLYNDYHLCCIIQYI